MSADRYQANITVRITPGLVVGTNDGKTGVFTCSTTVGLQGSTVESSDGA